MIYPSQQSDYFPKCWNNQEFNDYFDIFIQKEGYIATTDDGFIRLSVIGKILQTVKGFFGGTNLSQNERVQAAWLKFIYYGRANGFLTSEHVNQLKQQVKQQELTPKKGNANDQAIVNFFKIITSESQKKTPLQKTLNELRESIQDYHKRHAFSLRPGLWGRLKTSSCLEKSALRCFGDTPLQLSEKAIDQQPPNLQQGWFYLSQAFALKNNSVEFQEKLATHLSKLENLSINQVNKQDLQAVWMELGRVAFENHLPKLGEKHLSHALEIDKKNSVIRNKIGEIYLINQQYSLALPFLPDLQKLDPKNIKWMQSIGIAYWETGNHEEAVKVFQTALSGISLDWENKEAANLYYRIGTAHLNNKIANANLTNAIENLSKALKLASSSSKSLYRADLYHAYVESWKICNKTFYQKYSQHWNDLLYDLPSTFCEEQQENISQICLGSAAYYFEQERNEAAISYLSHMHGLFKNDVSVKIEILDAIAERLPTGMFHSCFHSWMQQHSINPLLHAKIGHAYLKMKEMKLGLQVYNKSLSLFKAYEERKTPFDCEVKASVHGALGQIDLENKQYDPAIEHFKQAAEINPEAYSKLVSKGCLKAAEHEKTVTYVFASKRNAKITSYYQTAFHHHPENAPYLIEWMNLYLAAKKGQEAMNLFNAIQKQPWANNVLFKVEDLIELGHLYLKDNHHHTALKCYRKAFEADPKNIKCKKNYYEYALKLAESQHQKIQEQINKDNVETTKKDELIASLEKLTEFLKNISSNGFEKLENLKPQFEEKMASMYGTLATAYFNRFILPKPKRDMKQTNASGLKKHFSNHKENIQKAFLNLDKTIELQPNNPIWRFQKGMLLDFFEEYAETTIEEGKLLDFLGKHPGAIKEFESAIENLPKNHSNPYYHYMLGSCYYCVPEKGDANKHFELANSAASSQKYEKFMQDYQIWYTEFGCITKTKTIDPHQYTIKTSWF